MPSHKIAVVASAPVPIIHHVIPVPVPVIAKVEEPK